MERKRVLLDLFSGRWGWSRAFAKRGWKCLGVDIVDQSQESVPNGCEFLGMNVLDIEWSPYERAKFYDWIHEDPHGPFDAIVASPPCEEFSVHGMKHFHPHPKYPANGIRLFEHTRALCEASGLPYVIENVRAAQQFVGNAVHHCGPFYLWGNAVPPLLNQGIVKGMSAFQGDLNKQERKLPLAIKTQLRKQRGNGLYEKAGSIRSSQTATIPPELANTVAEYMERLLEK